MKACRPSTPEGPGLGRGLLRIRAAFGPRALTRAFYRVTLVNVVGGSVLSRIHPDPVRATTLPVRNGPDRSRRGRQRVRPVECSIGSLHLFILTSVRLAHTRKNSDLVDKRRPEER